jgi:L-threonylcarbamoyladenylate synthase
MNEQGNVLEQAAQQLEQGRLVAFPTETVYGLGADAENPQAVAAIYAAKGRPSNHPVIVHLAPEADLSHWVQDVPAAAQQLIDAFWPGPLTLILKRAAHIPDAVSGGQDTIGVRCPSHPVAQALLRQFKGGQGGVAAPSANKFGHVSPTTAQHVCNEFPDECASGMIASVLDGGQSDVGIESTIVDMSRLETHGPVLLRPGHISAQDIQAVLGQAPQAADQKAPRASGTLESHYAPATPVVLVASEQLASVLEQLSLKHKKATLICAQTQVLAHHVCLIGVKNLGLNSVAYAHDIYASLRELDQLNSDVILIEALPQEASWQGVNDRLNRAAFDSQGFLQSLLGT